MFGIPKPEWFCLQYWGEDFRWRNENVKEGLYMVAVEQSTFELGQYDTDKLKKKGVFSEV